MVDVKKFDKAQNWEAVIRKKLMTLKKGDRFIFYPGGNLLPAIAYVVEDGALSRVCIDRFFVASPIISS